MGAKRKEPVAKNHLSDIDYKHTAFCVAGKVPDAVYAIVKSESTPEGLEPVAVNVPLAKVDAAKKQVFGYVLVPDKPDHEGDVVSKAEIEKAAASLMKNLSHGTADGTGASDEHYTIGGGFPIEVAVDTGGVIHKARTGTEGIDGALWVGMQVTDEGIWDKIAKGTYTSFSLGGFGKRTAVKKSDSGEGEDDAASVLAKVGKALQSGIDKLVDLAKGDGDALTYNDAQALRNVKDQIWKKQWQLEDSITSILGDDTVEDKVGMISTSIDQYKTDMLGLIAQMVAIKSKNKQQTNKSLSSPEEGEAMTKEELDQLSKSITDGVNDNIKAQYGEKLAKLDKIDAIETRLDSLEKAQRGETEESPIAALKKELGDIGTKVTDAIGRLAKMEKTPTGPVGDPNPSTRIEKQLTPAEERSESLRKSGAALLGTGD